jgi:hypothetical protein
MKVPKNTKKVFLLMILLFNTGKAFCQKNRESNTTGNVAIVNVNIIEVEDGTVLENRTIIIKDNYITEIGPSNKLKHQKQVRIINGKGKYIIPGLWDMHAHTSSETNTRGIVYPLFIANGITSLRVMSADCFDPCWPLSMNITQSRKLQKDVKSGKLIGPRTILGSIYVNGARAGDSSTIKAPATLEHGSQLVSLLLERDVDFIKISDGIPRDAYFGIAKEAKRQNIPFAGHNPLDLKTSEISDAGQKSIEHCCEGNLFKECSTLEDELRKKYNELFLSENPKNAYDLVLEMVKTYDKTKCENIFKKFVENKTWFVPTLFVEDVGQSYKANWRNDPRLKYVPENEQKQWAEDETMINNFFGTPYPEIRQKRFEIVRSMQKAGVSILAGSDCGVYGAFYGSSLHDELELLVEAGLTELEALQSATIKPAQYAQLSDSLGTIKKGMLADFILLDANPLKNIINTRRIHSVVSNGQLFDRKNLDTLLEKTAIEAAK